MLKKKKRRRNKVNVKRVVEVEKAARHIRSCLSGSAVLMLAQT